MDDQDFFYAVQGLHFYKVFVNSDGIAGARVAGTEYDEASVKASSMRVMGHFGLLGALISLPFVKMRLKVVLRKRAEEEATYDNLTPGSPEFLAKHKANFSWPNGQVGAALVKPAATGMKKMFRNQPTLEVNLVTGKKQKFILPLSQNPEFIVHLLKAAAPMVQLEGAPSPGGAFN